MGRGAKVSCCASKRIVFQAVVSLLTASALYMLATPIFPTYLPGSQTSRYDPFLFFSRCDTGATVYNKSLNVQLSEIQTMWIADMLHLAYSVNRKKPHLLVFGVGNDSPMWQQINCNGRTVFVEDDAHWIESVSSTYPSLEIHNVDYKSSITRLADFWVNPIDLHIHNSVDSVCFDVVLIDGPKGYRPEHPGRMIPAHYSIQMARKCKTATIIFLHDMGRDVEQLIGKNLFPKAKGWHNLGHISGPYGILTAWILTS